MPSVTSDEVLGVRDLRTVFHTRDGIIHAVNDVSFSLRAGELLGIVGESGCGKSVTMMSLLNLLPRPPAEIVGGEVMFDGRDLLRLDESALRDIRGGDIGFIFQDPMTSLNPVFTVGYQIIEPLRIHMGLGRRAARSRAVELLDLVGIPSASARMNDYPHQFSGGMRQRVMIAIALACNPKLLIADEATTALDVTVQAQILELIKDLRQKLGMSIIWITHDLGVIAGIADRVAVMYGGRIVEYADVETLYADPRHPYTRALLATLPDHDGTTKKRLLTIEGQAPNLMEFPRSCPFGVRCEHRHARCDSESPPLFEVTPDHHYSACWLEDSSNE